MEREKRLSNVAAAGGIGLLAAALALIPATTRSEPAAVADLAGVSGVQINISQTTPDAMTCGVDLRVLVPLLSKELVAGGLSIDPEAEVTVTLSVLTGYHAASDVCASAPMLGAYRRVSYFDEKAGWLRNGQVVLWQRGTTTATASADHDQALRHAVSGLSGVLLESWRTDNASGMAKR